MDFRQRLEQSRTPSTGNSTVVDAGEAFACPYYGTERGNSPACIDLRFADDSRKAVPYAYLVGISLDADNGIEIMTTQKSITISGRNLGALYEALINYRVRYVQEDLGMDAQEDGLFVQLIRMEERGI